jgi:uncharacterized membrane protein
LDSLFALAIALVVGIPLAVIYLLFSNAGLRKRVAALEDAGKKLAPVQSAEAAPDPIIKSEPKPADPVKQAGRARPSEYPKVENPKIADSDSVGPPKTVVLTKERKDALVVWLMQNWFYAVSAVSLALAGIFLVQYGIEQGLLPPWLRVTAAIAFGATLISAGEYIRRRFGDTDDSATAYLPSTFSSAGIVTLFAAILSARALYGLVGAELALVGMALVGAVAMVLGWFYGPLLAAIGVIGAMVAPFVVGGASDDPSWLFLYFMIVTVVGLAIDTVRRWAWISMLSLGLGFATGLFLTISAPQLTEPFFMLYCAALTFVAITIPMRRLMPDHTGTPLSLAFFARSKGQLWPEFPTRLAGGAVLAASALIILTGFDSGRVDVFWTAVVTLTALALALLVWARNAPALSDLVLLPTVALIIVIAGGWRIWAAEAVEASEPEADMAMLATWIVGIGLLISAVAAWRSLRGGPAKVFLAAGAAITAPAFAITIEVLWTPTAALGAYFWGLHALAIAALMVWMAERFARADGPDDRLRMSLAVLSALASIAFALVILFSSAALTVAIVVTIVAAAWLDRQFNLPLMGFYILAGVATVGFRLVADPGLDWATGAPLLELLLSHGGAVLGLAVSWWFARQAIRPRTEVLLESAVYSSTGILLSLLLYRSIETLAGRSGTESHWWFGIVATIWIILGQSQLRRLAMGGSLRMVRKALAGIFLLIGAVLLGIAALFLNPLFSGQYDPVLGPLLLNTLIPAYLLPAVALAFGANWLRALPVAIWGVMLAAATGLSALWLGSEIRHFWRGAEGMLLPTIEQPELYSYTVALLLVGAGLFYQSLSRKSSILRKAGLLVIGLAVAKVFLIDIAGLGGLIRVFSLLFLGLALAALAWLNRWASGQGNIKGEVEEE